ncbi:MAG: hypothetical protein QG600_61 [Patescibacteria group bacterium]|jgi:hypothetical protein|nr:hypothetical protein [Patescibacteria group bacterium]
MSQNMQNMKPNVDVREATHVEVGGQIQKISSTWGISPEGKFEKGGFGVVTTNGRRVPMLEASRYFKQEERPGQ